jgi:hypothetical protein
MSAVRLVAACLAAAGLALAATALAAVKPKVGAYQGTVNGTPTTKGHNEGEGYFDLKVISGKRKIVPHAPIEKIMAPSDFRCHQFNAYIEAKRIRVSGGAFKYSGTARIGPGPSNRHIIFKGKWTNATHLAGSTRVIKPGGSCDKTVRWKMKTPLPPFSP